MIRRALSPIFIALIIVGVAFAASAPPELMLDANIESMKQAGVGPVKFTHGAHEKRVKCDACHPKLFKDKRGASNITMKGNMDGKFCGSPNCHNSKAAFPLFECTKCHTQVKTK